MAVLDMDVPRWILLGPLGPLGLPPCDFPCRLGGVLISKVVPDGLVDRWNHQQKAAGAAGSSRIKVGDRIIALNGDELKGDDLLERLKTFGWPCCSFFLGAIGRARESVY